MNIRHGLNVIRHSGLWLLLAAGLAAFGCSGPEKTEDRGAEEVGMSVNGVTTNGNAQVSERGVIEKSAAFDGVKSIELEIGNAEIRCVDANLAKGAAKVSWRISPPDSPWGKGGSVDDIEVFAEEVDGVLRVYEKRNKHMFNSPKLEIWVKAHKEIPVEASLGNGTLELDVPKINDVSLGNGTIDLNGTLLGNAGVSLGNGTISGAVGVIDGNHAISLGNGEIRLYLSEGSSAKVSCDAGIGNVQIDGADAKSERGFLGGSAKADIGGADGTLEVSTGNGSIKLMVQ